MRLTGRSVVLIVVAALSLLLAMVAGIPALLYVVGVCLGLVIAAVLLTLVARPRLELTRTVVPAIVEPDDPAQVRIDLAVRVSMPLVLSTWHDKLPTRVSGAASGTVPVTANRDAVICYDVYGRRRGSHEIGPFSVEVGDAFGLVQRTLTHPGRHRLVVLPKRRQLDTRSGPAGSADGTSRARRTSGLGQDDVIARPYLPGDALKRWHWKATAHHGEPMVRQEESELRPTVLVILDTDPRVHDEAGFEWSVSAAASVVTHYGERGFDVELVSGPSLVSLESGHGLADALVTLALVEPSTAPAFVPVRECATFVMTGRLDASASRRLVENTAARDVIVFVGWGTTDAALEVLSRAGWHAVVCDSSDDLSDVWVRATEEALR